MKTDLHRVSRPSARSRRPPASALLLGLGLAFFLTAAAPAQAPPGEEEDIWAGSRHLMMEAVEIDVAYHGRTLGKDTVSPRVLAAVAAVPRHEFVPPGEEAWAYENRAIPIGHGRTLQKPFLSAVVAEGLTLLPRDKVLEIGTGNGYQTAVLAPLVSHVYSLEPDAELAAEAAENLAALGVDNVTIARGDGRAGWPQHALYDAIVLNLAVEEVPPDLLLQLRPGGKLLVPLLDRQSGAQVLTLVFKNEKSRLRPRPRPILQTSFEPLP